jgi:hypothetical protein
LHKIEPRCGLIIPFVILQTSFGQKKSLIHGQQKIQNFTTIFNSRYGQ